jgi:hypothetical protein
MTLPKKAEKEYLQVTGSPAGPRIVGQKSHVIELAALLEQRGIPCRRVSGTQSDEVVLVFDPDADVEAVKQVLEAYKGARGS